MAYREIPNSTRRQALSLYRRGLSGEAVGRRLGVSGWTVLRWAREAGISRDLRESRAARESRAQGRDYRRLRERGVVMLRVANRPAGKIAEALGVAVHMVEAWARQAGIDLVERRRERGWHEGRT